MPRNQGQLPPEAIGKRVRVRTFGGYDTAEKEPNGWAADGKGGCNWRISSPPHPYEIQFWKVL